LVDKTWQITFDNNSVRSWLISVFFNQEEIRHLLVIRCFTSP